MQRDPRAWLYDVLQAVRHLEQFIDGVEYSDYLTDVKLRSAVERQFEIIGEALHRLEKYNPELACRITECRRIIDFRNVISHGYDSVMHDVVWDIIQTHISPLSGEVQILLHELK